MIHSLKPKFGYTSCQILFHSTKTSASGKSEIHESQSIKSPSESNETPSVLPPPQKNLHIHSESNDIAVGQKYSISKTFTHEDLVQFSQLTLDSNPIHIDPVAATSSPFKKQVVHGMFTASLIPATIGTTWPGSIYLEQNMKFIAPAFINDTIHTVIVVKDVKPQNGRIYFDTRCENQKYEPIIIGEAIAYFPWMDSRKSRQS